MFKIHFACKVTKKSANRTYTIYGFSYPFYRIYQSTLF